MALGPADYRVVLQARGGLRRLAELPWTSISWGRAVDSLTEASVRVPLNRLEGGAAAQLAKMKPWSAELSLWRAGPDFVQREVWAGPVLEPTWDQDGVTLAARDLTQWWERRFLPFDRDFVNVDLGTVFAQLAEDAMALGPSPNLIVIAHPTGQVGTRTIKASAFPIAADVLRELARTAVDYTVIGRTVYVGGTEVPFARLPPLTASALEEVKIRDAGLSTATDVAVVGSSTRAGQSLPAPVTGRRSQASEELGLVQRLFQESSIEDELSANANANTRWESLRYAPTFVGARLRHRGAPPFEQLVPGVVARVEASAGVRSVAEDFRLSTLRVSASASEQGITETIDVEFIPVGTGAGSVTAKSSVLDDVSPAGPELDVVPTHEAASSGPSISAEPPSGTVGSDPAISVEPTSGARESGGVTWDAHIPYDDHTPYDGV